MRIWRISSATRWRRRWRQCCRTPGPGARQGRGWRRAAKPRLRPTRFPACRRPRRCAPGPTRMPRNAMPRCWKRPPTRWSSSWRWPGWRRPGRWRPRSRPWRSGRATLPSATNSTTRLRCCWRRTIPRARSCRESSGKTPGAGRSMASGCGRMWANPRCPAPRKPPCCPVSSPGCARWRGSQGRASRRPLLATPTDTQGWVDADVLLARYEAGKESGAPFPVDLTQALLRVPPEQRARVVEPPAARGRGSPTPCGSSGTAVGRKLERPMALRNGCGGTPRSKRSPWKRLRPRSRR